MLVTVLSVGKFIDKIVVLKKGKKSL